MSGNRVLEADQQLFELTLATDEGSPSRFGAGRALGDEVECRVLVEDRLLQLTQLPTWLDAELLDQHRAGVLIGLERLRVST